MDANAILLIDLENFFIGREEQYRAQAGANARPYRGDPFEEDLESLLGFAQEMAGGRRLLIRRAYANFNASYQRPLPRGGYTRDWYLQGVPDTLMRYGVEPVQVFRFPGGGNKNAADMRLAMDATALLVSGGGTRVEQFIIVTGDADFIPLTLELKRHGMQVGIIGVQGRTNEIFERYCDNFVLFEELLAAREVGADVVDAATPIGEVAAALKRLLEKNRPIKFAAVKPLLGKELNRPFDPTLFGTDNTGAFLERFKDELGIAIHKTTHDKVIDIPGAAPAVAQPPDAHAPQKYQHLLKQGGRGATERNTRFYVHPWPVFCAVTDAAFASLHGAQGPIRVTADQLHDATVARLSSGDTFVTELQLTNIEYMILWQFTDSVGAEDGTTIRYVQLNDAIDSADELRRWLLNAMLYLLKLRLEERDVDGQIRADVFARMVAGVDSPPAEFVDVIAKLVEDIYAPPAAEQAPAVEPPAGAAAGQVHPDLPTVST